MPKGDKKKRKRCRGCRRPQVSFKENIGSDVIRCTVRHCAWCECGEYRGHRACCQRCLRIDGCGKNFSVTRFEIVQIIRSADGPISTREIRYGTQRDRAALMRTLQVMEKDGTLKKYTFDDTQAVKWGLG